MTQTLFFSSDGSFKKSYNNYNSTLFHLIRICLQYEEKVICFKNHYSVKDLFYAIVSFRKQGV